MHPLFHRLYVDYCSYFNGNQDYFECHEVLEEYWKQQAPGDKVHPLVGYVQLATGMYHWRRNNDIGAMKILKKALTNFSMNEGSLYFDYINFDELYQNTKTAIDAIENGKSFQPFQLTFITEEFSQKVEARINELPTLADDFLLHKHMLRDRSDILEARRIKKLQSPRTTE